MSRRSIAPLLRDNHGLALCDRMQNSPTLKLLSVDADRTGEGAVQCGITPHCRRLLRIPFNRGEVQLVSRGADLVLDITAQHYDVAGYARREHAWAALSRSETQHLILALATFWPSHPTSRMPRDSSVSNPTRR